jgi:hypothetical protein
MSEPVQDKNNEHIGANKKAFASAYLRACEELGRLEGVVGVGFGRKEVNGTFTGDVAIEVFVREKKTDGELPVEQRIPKRFDGYRTDVRVVSGGQEAADTGGADIQPYATIVGGIAIEAFPRNTTALPAPGDREVGTLGCIVKKRGNTSSDNVYLLTCRHVLRDAGTEEGDFVYQPNGPLLEGGIGAGTIVAKIDRAGVNYYGAIDYSAQEVLDPASTTNPPQKRVIQCYVDAGIAKVDVKSKCCDTPCGSGGTEYDTTIVGLTDLGLASNEIANVRNLLLDVDITLPGADKHVYKRGHKTRGTIGIVTAVNTPFDFYSETGTLIKTVNNVIEIAYEVTTARPKNNQGNIAFSDFGDSGSIVLDAQNRAVGMIFGHEKHPFKTSDTDVLTYKVYACHIVPVLDVLGVCIVTSGGTQYGACGAKDGSGLIGAADKTIDSQGQRTVAVQRRGAGSAPPQPNVSPLSASERDRFVAIRAALRETSRGRQLDDTFMAVRDEIGILVRTCRPVTVIWHRNRGPAFLAHAINHLRGDAESVPREIAGITREMMLTRMRDVLMVHGSIVLRRAIERHGADLILLAESENVDDCVRTLRELESTETPA